METDALKKYEILMSYLQYENSMYWERSNFFLIANTALFGIAASNILSFTTIGLTHKTIVFVIMIGAGLYLTFLWHQGIKAGEYWIERWHTLLRELEPKAFGNMRVIRARNTSNKKRVSARGVQKKALFLFYILWSFLFAYSIASAFLFK